VSAVAIVAFGAISGLGEGGAAFAADELGARARVAIDRDEELTRAGLRRPFAARVHALKSDDRATELLDRALAACASELDRVRPSWRAERVGLVLGTSSGGIRAAEHAFAAMARGERVADIEAPTYFGPMARAARCLHVPLDPSLLVLGACASGAIAIGLATRWLARGACDIVLAGGFDEVTVFVASGFEALRATTAAPPPRPFRLGRDGMSLGEGAAVLALACTEGPEAKAFVTGFGASSDAVHLTAPDREGAGLARAAAAAIEEAGQPGVDLVSAHGTATPFNDAAEFRAMARALGRERSLEVPVHAFKAQVGHTLGAAGALELLVGIDAIGRGVLPASVTEGVPDPDAPARLLERSVAGAPQTVLKLASAFGGANAALVVQARPGRSAPASRAAFLGAAVHVSHEPPLQDLAARLRTTVDRLARADSLVHLALASVARLEAACGPLAGAGVVVGTALATLETNALFAARIRERGATAAEPRRFPYTSPNAVAGECSMAFGLTGPTFSVGGGMHAALEALAAGALLVEGGDADRIVVVAVDDVGPATRALAGDSLSPGAVALLLTATVGGAARARVGEVTLRRGESVSAPLAPGHLALLPLVQGAVPSELVCTSPPDVLARVALEPV
jgi:3-oxoacyl-[acyl-carrier-protein] synthase II